AEPRPTCRRGPLPRRAARRAPRRADDPGDAGGDRRAVRAVGDGAGPRWRAPRPHASRGVRYRGRRRFDSLNRLSGGVRDVAARFTRAVDAGAKVLRPIADQFYGNRSGTVQDPFGHTWTIATHIEDVAPEEMARRMAELPPPG